MVFFKVLKVFKDFKDFKVFKGFKDFKDFKVFRGFPPKLATFQKKSDATIATSEVFAYGVYSILHKGDCPFCVII